MSHLALTLVLPFLISLPAFAQADYYANDTLELPTLATAQVDSDHAVISVNSYGDVVVVNQATVSGDQKLIEANALSPNGSSNADGFTLHPIMLLGDPALDVLGAGADTCKKPDVEVLGDDSFMVVWSRHDMHVSNQYNSHLEACLITMRDSNGVLYSQPLVTSFLPGQGFLIDDLAKSGNSGLMPDIAALGSSDPRKAYVVYAHETYYQRRAVNTYSEYDLRCATIDWNNMPTTSPRFNQAIETIESYIPFDNLNAFPYSSGLILPDVVLDDLGNLVVCFEQFVIAPHRLHTGPEKGSIQVRRYQPNSAPSPFAAIDSIELLGNRSYRHQRRPMISSSTADADNTVLIGWSEKDDDLSVRRRAVFKTLSFSAPGSVQIKTLPWNETFGDQDELPTTAMSGNVKLAAASREFPSANYLFLTYKNALGGSAMAPADTTVPFPHRSAFVLLDRPNFTFSYCAFEGDATNSSLQRRIYLLISRL